MTLASETHKWLYVTEYEDGCVKVGVSGRPARRISQIRRPEEMGKSLMTRHHILVDLEMPTHDALLAECGALEEVGSLADRRVMDEWFYGVPYQAAIEVAAKHAMKHRLNPTVVALPEWATFDFDTDEVMASVRDHSRNLAELSVKSGVSVRALMGIRHNQNANPRMSTLAAIAKAIAACQK